MVGSAISAGAVDLHWLPVGAGAHVARRCVRIYEALAAAREHRERCDIYHAALEVHLDGVRYVIESAPAWGRAEPDRGVVAVGPVGLPWLGRSKWFRYEIRRWRDGLIPDVAAAVDSPRRVSDSRRQAADLLAATSAFPPLTWGRDELGTSDMWNSNSLVSWLLVRSGHDVERIRPPARGRAPGWTAGIRAAQRAPTPATPPPSVATPVGPRGARTWQGRARRAAYELVVGGARVAGALVTAPVARRSYNRHGATDEELARPLPGDELVREPKLGYTRALTIDAPVAAVWPWLVQFGRGRGGFYSYDALENLLGCGIHSVDELLPEHQQLQVGDLIRSGPDTMPCWQVVEVHPPHVLVLLGAGTPADPQLPEVGDAVPDRGYVASTWQWALEPLDKGRRTRLIVRQRLTYSPNQSVLWHVVEPLNFVMEHRMLRGIRQRAEQHRAEQQRAEQHRATPGESVVGDHTGVG